jgi:hypothetical protein
VPLSGGPNDPSNEGPPHLLRGAIDEPGNRGYEDSCPPFGRAREGSRMAATMTLLQHRVHTRTLSIIPRRASGCLPPSSSRSPSGRRSAGRRGRIEPRRASHRASGCKWRCGWRLRVRGAHHPGPRGSRRIAALRWGGAVGAWIITGLSAVGSLMNFASQSDWEPFQWGPFALVLTIPCFLVAWSDPEHSSG